MNEAISSSIEERLRVAMTQRGIKTREELCRRWGKPVRALDDFLLTGGASCSLPDGMRLSAVLGVRIWWLMHDRGLMVAADLKGDESIEGRAARVASRLSPTGASEWISIGEYLMRLGR